MLAAFKLLITDSGKCGTGYSSVSVLVTQHTLAPLRMGFLRRGDTYEADPLLSFVEPLTAEVHPIMLAYLITSP